MRDAYVRVAALAPGIVPLGALFGATAVSAGFHPVSAILMSAFAFAGTAQFAAVGLVEQGAGVLAIVALVFVINARYLLLSTAALEMVRPDGPGPIARHIVAFFVVDETYALQTAWRKGGAVGVFPVIAVGFAAWTVWLAATIIGSLLGTRIPALGPYGLDYALPGLFIGLIGIFAETRTHLLVGLGAVAIAGALAYVGLGTVAAVGLPPVLSWAVGRWRRGAA